MEFNWPKSKFIIRTLVCSSIVLNLANADSIDFPLDDQGNVPVWLVVGPFNQPISGFGTVDDVASIDEAGIRPQIGQEEQSSLTADANISWRPVQTDALGYTDINSVIGWTLPADLPVIPWYGRAAYAVTYLDSPIDQEVLLILGSHNRIKVLVNGEEVFNHDGLREAKSNQDTVGINLHQGENTILIKAFHTHHDYGAQFFFDPGYGWGFYARVIDLNEASAPKLTVTIPDNRIETEYGVISTFFYKRDNKGKLKQRFDLEISSVTATTSGDLLLVIDGKTYTIGLQQIPFGYSRHSFYLPALTHEIVIESQLFMDSRILTTNLRLQPRKQYELHLMMLSHMDIGYTHIQPVVEERHVRILDDVVAKCLTDKNFKWTIETIWQLEQYEISRSPGAFRQLVDLIKSGRIAVSPNYSNPFTGMTSEEELIRSFKKARDYQKRFGIEYKALIYNDTPGMSWLVPQLLGEIGINFLVCGINEVYTDYPLQRALPKVFEWEGGDGSTVTTYLTETYNEGVLLGLEKSSEATEYRLWQRLNRLEAKGYQSNKVLVNAAWGDNTGYPQVQYSNASKWNAQYAYPKFIISNLNQFTSDFMVEQNDLRRIRGDWTSSWSTRSQGEPNLNLQVRWIQNQITGAEKLNTINWLLADDQLPLSSEVDEVYTQLLHFSGHGSGLEYGYGTAAENRLTLDYRENYIEQARLSTWNVLARSVFRLSIPEESLESEAILVYNQLAYETGAVIEVEFSSNFSQPAQVIDLSTGTTLLSYNENNSLYFRSDNLPALGYKKFQLIRNPVGELTAPDTDLEIGAFQIANAKYKITVNDQTGEITSFYDLEDQRELISSDTEIPFFTPVVNKPYQDNRITALTSTNIEVSIIDQRPIKVQIVINRPDQLFSQSCYSLSSGSDELEILHTLSLDRLRAPETLEEYGICFPVSLKQCHIALDLAGGFITTENDLLPGGQTGYYSVRRGLALFDDDYTLNVGLLDGRNVKAELNGNTVETVTALLVNNFPVDWNRSEKNEGNLDFRFVVAGGRGSFDPGRFARQLDPFFNSPVPLRTWMRTEPGAASYFAVSDPRIQIITIAPATIEEGFIIRLRNSGQEQIAGELRSPFFTGRTASQVSFWEQEIMDLNINQDLITINLGANEIQTILVKL